MKIIKKYILIFLFFLLPGVASALPCGKDLHEKKHSIFLYDTGCFIEQTNRKKINSFLQKKSKNTLSINLVLIKEPGKVTQWLKNLDDDIFQDDLFIIYYPKYKLFKLNNDNSYIYSKTIEKIGKENTEKYNQIEDTVVKTISDFYNLIEEEANLWQFYYGHPIDEYAIALLFFLILLSVINLIIHKEKSLIWALIYEFYRMIAFWRWGKQINYNTTEYIRKSGHGEVIDLELSEDEKKIDKERK